MVKTFKYRIYPTKKQTRLLNDQLNKCRWLYNQLVEERKISWQKEKKSLSYYTQATKIPKLKKEHPGLNSVYSQVLQNVAVRVDLTYL